MSKFCHLSTNRRLGAIAATMFLLAACAPTLERSETALSATARPAEGQRLAEIHCARCHAIGAAGESRHPMAPPFRTLSRNYPVNALEEAFAEGILVGHRDMPEFLLEPSQIDDLVAYLNSIQEQRGA
jgi:mono/diheme cytochrome c family protein